MESFLFHVFWDKISYVMQENNLKFLGKYAITVQKVEDYKEYVMLFNGYLKAPLLGVFGKDTDCGRREKKY